MSFKELLNVHVVRIQQLPETLLDANGGQFAFQQRSDIAPVKCGNRFDQYRVIVDGRKGRGGFGSHAGAGYISTRLFIHAGANQKSWENKSVIKDTLMRPASTLVPWN